MRIKNMREIAIQLLARREHSQTELKRKLITKGFEPKQIELLLDSLSKTKLQSDDRFTEMYVRTRKKAGFGPKKIAMELQEHGISKNLIHDYINEQDTNWRLQMITAWKKRFSGSEPLEKQFRFLQQRGYPVEFIYQFFQKNTREIE